MTEHFKFVTRDGSNPGVTRSVTLKSLQCSVTEGYGGWGLIWIPER